MRAGLQWPSVPPISPSHQGFTSLIYLVEVLTRRDIPKITSKSEDTVSRVDPKSLELPGRGALLWTAAHCRCLWLL